MFNIEIFWNFDTGVQKNIFCFFLKKWEASFTTIFEKKKISHVLLTDQILLPDFVKLHKILRKILVIF